MMGRGVGGRGRPHSEDSSRFEERDHRGGQVKAPPSRHLWVGNLSQHASQSAISEQFLRFGDLDNISYIPGRSFAFVNYKRKEDAIIALRGLNGVTVAGLPLKIEFAKGDKASMVPQAEEHMQYNDARHSMERVDSLSRRDSRPRRLSPEKPHDKSKGNKSLEPCEMLWIGFPSIADVNELDLRRAFQPFGEIEKISTFPGRSYAFVRYRSTVAACRAREALQGKLFNNPRISICFARNDSSAEQGRGSTSAPFPHHTKSNFPPVMSVQGGEAFQRERSFENPIRGELPMAAPRYMSKFDQMHGDANIMGVGGSSVQSGAVPGPDFGGALERGRLQDLSVETRMVEVPYEYHRDGPAVEKNAPWLDFSFERARRAPSFEDSWGTEKGTFPLVKKLKTDTLHVSELPEYPFSDMESEKRNIGLPNPKQFPVMPEQHSFNRSFETVPLGYKGTPDYSRTKVHPQNEINDSWRKFDGPVAASARSLLDPSKLQILNSEPHQPPRKEEWKWEGTIAKGGTAVCRARCFPVGKVLDFMLPEFLNCTARTGLDMLSKHYYQAANTWVVFFVPETDADISYYNEFMHYLGEKQRAAVAKLGEKVSLFLVPPSDFSEQVLKVPGKVSISGVILKFQHPSSSFSSLDNPMEALESNPLCLMRQQSEETSSNRETSFLKPSSPEFRPFSQGQSNFGPSSGHVPPLPSSFPPPSPPQRPQPHKLSDDSFPMANVQDSRQDFQHQTPPFPSNWSNNPHLLSSSFGTFPPPDANAVSRTLDNSKAEDYVLTNPRGAQGTTSSSYMPEAPGVVPLPSGNVSQQQETKPQVSSAAQLPLQPEQLVQLAALLAQQKQYGNPNLAAESQQSNITLNSSSQTQASVSHVLTVPHAPQPFVGSHVSQPQQLHQQSSAVPASQQSIGNPVQQNSQQTSVNTREETEGDPQMRLQATLQLAAVLLQQIQQQSKT